MHPSSNIRSRGPLSHFKPQNPNSAPISISSKTFLKFLQVAFGERSDHLQTLRVSKRPVSPILSFQKHPFPLTLPP